MTKKAIAAAARERGDDQFIGHCKACGTETPHHTSDAKCIACKYERHKRWRATPEGREISNRSNRASEARARATPEGQARRKAYRRTAHVKLYQDPERVEALNARNREAYATRPHLRGYAREEAAAKAWKAAAEATAFPASYPGEREALRKLYAECPAGFEIDHVTPKKAKNFQGKWVAVGLLTVSNVQAIPKALNREKRSYFDPDNFREQRPANAFPGGAWDPELTEQEWARVELLVRRYGHGRDATVKETQAQIARQHTIYIQTTAA